MYFRVSFFIIPSAPITTQIVFKFPHFCHFYFEDFIFETLNIFTSKYSGIQHSACTCSFFEVFDYYVWFLALPILWRPPYIAFPPFFQCCPHSSTSNLSQSLNPPFQLLFLTLFIDWKGDRATFDVLFYLLLLYICKCQAWVP